MYIMNAVLGHYCVTGTLISFIHYVPSFWICSFCRKHNPVLSSFIMTYHHITWVHPRFVMEILVLACNILQKIVLFFWLFNFFWLCHCVLSVFRFMASDYPCDIYQLFYIASTLLWQNRLYTIHPVFDKHYVTSVQVCKLLIHYVHK
jgi:hypothetical protein